MYKMYIQMKNMIKQQKITIKLIQTKQKEMRKEQKVKYVTEMINYVNFLILTEPMHFNQIDLKSQIVLMINLTECGFCTK